MAENPFGQIAPSAVGVGQRALGIAGDGVDGEVAARQVFFECHGRIGVKNEAGVARRRLAFGAGQRVFLAGARVEEDRKILADRLVALGQQHFRGGAHHHPVVILDRQAKEFVADGTANAVNLHLYSRRSCHAAKRARLLAEPR